MPPAAGRDGSRPPLPEILAAPERSRLALGARRPILREDVTRRDSSRGARGGGAAVRRRRRAVERAAPLALGVAVLSAERRAAGAPRHRSRQARAAGRAARPAASRLRSARAAAVAVRLRRRSMAATHRVALVAATAGDRRGRAPGRRWSPSGPRRGRRAETPVSDQEPTSELVRGLREQLRQAERRIDSVRDDHHLTNRGPARRQRGAAEPQRGIPFDDRGAGDQQGGAAEHQRGAADRQSRAEGEARGGFARPQRPREPHGRDRRGDAVPESRSADQDDSRRSSASSSTSRRGISTARSAT